MLDAVKALLKSRKALLIFIGSAFTLAVHFVPELEPLKGDAVTFVDALLGVLVAAIAYEDGKQKAAG